MGEPPIQFIVGPSAAGKTALALGRAEADGAEILSCDALLVYRGMDIGTAKPTPAERARVPHHGIDLVPPDRTFSVADYLEIAQAAVEDILRRGRPVLVVGGSGFYLKSFFAPVVDRVKVPAALRQQVAELEAEGGLPALCDRLLRLDPEAGTGVDLANPRRVANALARCLASGKSVAELQKDFAAQEPPFAAYRKHVTLLQRPRDELRDRVFRRAGQMLAAGLLDEVETLLAAGIERNPSAAAAIGYRESIAYLRRAEGAAASPDELQATIAQNTLRLIKKQATWFRRQIPVDEVLRLGA